MTVLRLSRKVIPRSFPAKWARNFAVHPFKLPDIGEGIAEVQVMEWFVKEGDRVKEMDRLCLVESDKASVEISSRYHGVVKAIRVQANEQAKVGAVIVEIDDKEGTASGGSSSGSGQYGDAELKRGRMEHPAAPGLSKSIPDESPASIEETPGAMPSTSGKQDIGRVKPPKVGGASGEIRASPPVRQMAKSMGIDLSQVHATGKDGRITEEDLHAFKSGGGSSKPAPSKPKRETEQHRFETSLDMYGPAKKVVLTQVGLAMVKSMNDSLKVPQLTHSDEIECDRLVEVIRSLKPVAMDEFHLPSLTLTAFFIKAVSLGVEAYPTINSRMAPEGDAYHILQNHNVSVAMDSPRGLVVPNIRNVESLSIIEIQKHLIELQKRAKAGRLSLDDIRGGTVSFSNIGVIGGTYARPVVFDGQAVIGAIGRVQAVPRFSQTGQVVSKQIMNVSWTADHRHVDGATVARFSNVFKDAVENPERIVALHFR